jgi:hypothetical protein
MTATAPYNGGDGDSDFSRVLYHDLIVRLAVLVGASEAAGFEVLEVSPNVSLRLLEHVRPDKSSSETRAAAVKAFEEIVLRCVEKGKEGAMLITDSERPGQGAQYCLVTLTRDADRRLRAVSAFIVRCANQGEARQRLQMLKGSNSPYRNLQPRAEDSAVGSAAQASAAAASPSAWRAFNGWMSPNFGEIGWLGALLLYLLMVAGIAALLYMPWSLLRER